jgi:hypothetical protein
MARRILPYVTFRFGAPMVVLRGAAACAKGRYGAAQESNLPSVGLPRLTGFEEGFALTRKPYE